MSKGGLLLLFVVVEWFYFAICQFRYFIPLVLEVGTGLPGDRNDWMRSSVGMVLPVGEKPYIFTAENRDKYIENIERICGRLRETVLSEPIEAKIPASSEDVPNKDKNSLRASVPMVGDAVVAHYAAWQFFPAKVASFDKGSMKYTVDWDDPANF